MLRLDVDVSHRSRHRGDESCLAGLSLRWQRAESLCSPAIYHSLQGTSRPHYRPRLGTKRQHRSSPQAQLKGVMDSTRKHKRGFSSHRVGILDPSAGRHRRSSHTCRTCTCHTCTCVSGGAGGRPAGRGRVLSSWCRQRQRGIGKM